MYWSTGFLSGFLDNAPTYLNLLNAIMSTYDANIHNIENVKFYTKGIYSINNILELKAISIASVFFGALTYIGNGPNFIVKSIAEKYGIKMPSSWAEFNAAADKLQAKGIIPLAHGSQPWQDATVFEAVALGIGGNDFYKKAFVDADVATLGGSTMVKIFDQMRKLKGYTDAGSPGRDWNVATGMVMDGKAAFQIMGDWAKGEFSAKGLTPGKDYLCSPTPSNNGYLYNVDSFVFYNVKGADKLEGQKLLASLIMGKNFQKVFNMYKGSIPARLDVSMADFDDCAKKSNSDLNAASKAGGLMPSYAHGMALKGAQSGAITDVVTEHFNSNMSSKDAAKKLAAAVKASL